MPEGQERENSYDNNENKITKKISCFPLPSPPPKGEGAIAS
jgi:hypothetical protein